MHANDLADEKHLYQAGGTVELFNGREGAEGIGDPAVLPAITQVK
ncbi:hypothetical protein [Streptomyces sp. NPDC002403]